MGNRERAVEVAAKEGGFSVTTFTQSLPDAMAVVDRILQLPVPGAFVPDRLVSADGSRAWEARDGEIVCVPVPTEDEIVAKAPQAVADSEDTTEGLNAQTRAVVE